MRNPVKKRQNRQTAAKKAAKKQSPQEVKVVWQKSKDKKGYQSTFSNTLAGARYDVHPTTDGFTRLHVTGQNGMDLVGYTCKDVSTAELLVSLIEYGRLLP